MEALIGYTGFVGGNLARQHVFQHAYNSSNIGDIGGREYSLLVCAAPQAKKWWANKFPQEDARSIDDLLTVLRGVEADRVVLISTVDVFPVLTGVDETYDCSSRENHPYGRNRLMLEQGVAELFDKVHVIRLPALFGPGLRKNIIYDLVHDNQLDVINRGSSFQWYDVRRLWSDIAVAIEQDLPLVTLATEPIVTHTICERFFPERVVGGAAGPTVSYDVRTRYGALFGGPDGYIMDQVQVLDRLGDYLAGVRVGAA